MQTLPPPVDQLVGEALGNYSVKQLLGHGTINAVYSAQQQPQGQTVMLTAFMVPGTFSLQAREQFMTRFTQVASMLVRLDHPHILPTYDFGAEFGYPYLITPFVTGGSLAKTLQQEVRFTPQRVLAILKQIAEGLDYAQQNGMVHGTLKPANILLDEAQNVQITGFGLANILKMAGIESAATPYVHLLSIAGTFLGAAEYIAPEIVQGKPADARSDVYALGIMLFELLTGKLPFTGEDPFVVAVQHVQERVPSLHLLNPDVLSGLDLVVQKAVEVDPGQRFQSVSKLVGAFERVLAVIQEATSSGKNAKKVAPAMPEMTMPPTVNWDEEGMTGELGKLKSPLGGRPSKGTNPRMEAGNWQLQPPIVTSQLAAIKAGRAKVDGPNLARLYADTQDQTRRTDRRDVEILPTSIPHKTTDVAKVETRTDHKKAIDSFALWTSDAAFEVDGQGPGTFDMTEYSDSGIPDEQPKPARKGRWRGVLKKEPANAKKKSAREDRRVAATSEPSNKPERKRKPTPKGRRRVIALLATGGVVAAGVVGGGIGIMRIVHPQAAGNQAPAQMNNTAANPQGNAGKMKPATKAPAAKAQKAAHTGTVVGMKNQAVNSANGFKNPANNNDSLLVHLPNGNFVAYERACTHQQVPVDYHQDTHTFVCPLHGSIFDPAQKGKVLQGPANAPLPPVKVSINGDGTITVA